MKKITFQFHKAKLTQNECMLFMKRLSFLLGAGISLHSALSSLAHQSKKRIQPLIEKIAEHVNQGQAFSKSLEQFPNSFPLYAVRIIKAGEESSQLQQSLTQVADEMLKRKNLTTKIVSAAVYPFLIGCGTILLSLFLLLVIFPKVRSLFDSMHVTLPLSTRSILWLSNFIHHFGLLCIVFMISSFFIIRFSIQKHPELQLSINKFLFSLPLLGTLISHYILSVFFRTLGMMLKAHIPLSRSLAYATESISEIQYHEALHTISTETLSGSSLARSFKNYPKLFPEMSTQLIEVGETSGNLAHTLIYLSEMYDQEIEQSLKMLVSVIEPLLMALMGLVVGFISLSIITPIYAITQNIKH